jgi:uncharacterized protein
MPAFSLTLLPGRYAVCLLPPAVAIPSWANGGGFCSITRTADELSIICPQGSLPEDIGAVALEVARDWALLRVEGPFAFDVTGVLATLSAPLAAAGVVVLAVATYQTDYLLVKADQRERAMQALSQAGHSVAI